MSFQAYIDNIYTKTNKTPDDFLQAAKAKGLIAPDVKVMQIVNWLKDEYGLGHGHAMAIVQSFKNAGAYPVEKK
ncbi:MAG: hypothetical protein JWO07_472 [Candidatus Saccharibacteria bacterium]|nr:hypothetical protein [Candidatus Saccharibacteria bacterium]